MNLFRITVWTVAFATGLTVCHARDLVIDNVRGNDSQNDRGLVAQEASYGPYRTINRALIAARPGDRIVLTDTGIPYRECVSLVGPTHSGSPLLPFEIVGNGATLDGSITPASLQWEPLGSGLWGLRQNPAGFGLLLTKDGSLIHADAPADGNLEKLEVNAWTRIARRMIVRLPLDQSPAGLAIESTMHPTGITLYDVQNVVIRDLVVRGYRIDGINAHDRCSNVKLINVSARENGRSGLTVAGASRVEIGATLSELNGESQLRVEGRAIAYLGNVDVAEETDQGIVLADYGRVLRMEQTEN